MAATTMTATSAAVLSLQALSRRVAESAAELGRSKRASPVLETSKATIVLLGDLRARVEAGSPSARQEAAEVFSDAHRAMWTLLLSYRKRSRARGGPLDDPGTYVGEYIVEGISEPYAARVVRESFIRSGVITVPASGRIEVTPIIQVTTAPPVVDEEGVILPPLEPIPETEEKKGGGLMWAAGVFIVGGLVLVFGGGGRRRS